MSNISQWSTTAASNSSAAPDGFPEGQTPSSLNNCSREVMASVRRQHEDAQWIDLGDTTTYASATTFTVSGDVTTAYDVGRRVKATDSSTLYGVITVSNYSNPNTTVTVVLDSGSLSASLSAVALGVISGANNALNNTKLDSLGDQNVKLNTKVLSIGDWEMIGDPTTTIAHGLTLDKIRGVGVTIRNDATSKQDDLSFSGSNSRGTTLITLSRVSSGLFDSTDYDSTSYNRGWVTIQYVD